MSFLDRIMGRGSVESEKPETDIVLTVGDHSELARTNAATERSVTLATGERALAFASALVPTATASAQTVEMSALAVVRFPAGVGWADLFNRQSGVLDGWKSLGSKGTNGKFNKLGAVRKAGIQPTAVVNLALQGAALVVGQAYMTQINSRLEGIEQGIEELQRSMERADAAELKASYDALERLALLYEESTSTSEGLTVALQTVEDATRVAQEACSREGALMADIARSMRSKKSCKAKDLEIAIAKLNQAESRAATAFQLLATSRLAAMGLDRDYRKGRIDKELFIAEKAAGELAAARADAREAILSRISELKGMPLAVADPLDAREGAEGIGAVLDNMRRTASRVAPTRTREAAKENLAQERKRLRDATSTPSKVRELAQANASELDALSFAFNVADVLVIEGDEIRAVSLNPRVDS